MSKKTIETEIVIIGSGPVGATYARCLASHGKQVTMLEAGPQLRSRPGEHMLNCFRFQREPNLSLDTMMSHHEVFSVNPLPDDDYMKRDNFYNPVQERLNFENPLQDPNRNMPFAASMWGVGGMFSLWSGYAPFPTAKERTPLISPDDWEHILEIAKQIMNIHTDAFEPSVVNRAISAALTSEGRPAINMPMGAEKRRIDDKAYYVDWTGTSTMLGPLVDERGRLVPNFDIWEEHRAEKLELTPDSSRVTSALVRDLHSGEMKEFKAETFIIAGGPFLTPRLLWQSGIRPKALGCYLHENPVATCKVGLSEEFIEKLRQDEQNPARGEQIPIPWNDPAPKCGIMPTENEPWLIHLNRTGRSMSYDLKYDVRLSVDFTGYSTVESIPENRITFSDQYEDRFGQPQITVDYRVPEADQKTADRMVEDITELAGRIGPFLPFTRPPFEEKVHLEPSGTSLHMMGTHRMGEKASDDCVVDPNSKVWGVDNLYASGEGVINEPVASNPTLTITAIAAKSAASILNITTQQLMEDLRKQ